MSWHPSKKQSEGQLAQLHAVHAMKRSGHEQEKENQLITTFLPTSSVTLTRHINNTCIISEDQVITSQLQAEHFECQLHNE